MASQLGWGILRIYFNPCALGRAQVLLWNSSRDRISQLFIRNITGLSVCQPGFIRDRLCMVSNRYILSAIYSHRSVFSFIMFCMCSYIGIDLDFNQRTLTVCS